MMERARGMRRSVEAIAAMGLPGYLEFLGAGRAAPHWPVRARVHDAELHLRPRGPDLRVAICNLGAEFGALPRLLAGREPEVIVDAGGFIGTAALALARLFPRAVVLTLEPAPDNFAILSANVARHPRILPVHAALAGIGAGPQHLVDRGTGAWGYSLVSEGAPLGQVPTISLDKIAAALGPRRIGLLKLDIEGAEKALFDAPCPTLSRIPTVLAELHDRILPGCSAAFARFARNRCLQRIGPEKYLASLRPGSPRDG